MSDLRTEIEEEPRDGDETQDIFNYIDGAEIGNQPLNGCEVPHLAVEVEEVCEGEEKDWDCYEPFDPRTLDVERGPLGKIDTEEHEADWHGGLGCHIPE